MSLKPKVSVITVNFNMADRIAATLDSVLGQDYPNLESVVIDGGSTDGSQEIIASYGDRLAHWVSEPDRNLYDGMNKGVRMATGEWILFMNSGDCFANNKVLSCMLAEDHADIDMLYGHHIRRYPEHGIDRLIRAETPSVLPLRMLCSHQSLFMRREILLARPFVPDLMAADYETILAAYIAGRKFRMVDCIVSIASVGGRSDVDRVGMLRQRVAILKKHRVMTAGLALRYTGLICRAALSKPLKRLLPRGILFRILRHRPLKGLG